MSQDLHQTVMLEEAVEALALKSGGTYVDGTFGRGGHSRHILKGLCEGRLFGFDKDPEAISAGNVLETEDSRFTILHASFAEIKSRLLQSGVSGVDGILMDLGVSSPQLDDARRGFSFMGNGPLDMRMDTTSGQSAAEWIASAPENDIARVLKVYGEEKFARRMARAIVQARSVAPLVTTAQLAEVVAAANPAWEKGKHPATRAFQAIRIFINNELGDLESGLVAATEMLNPGGRLVVISFHSLEDRIVKRFMRDQAKGKEPPPGVPVFDSDIERPCRVVGKAVMPSSEEVDRNVRSRSAVMRVMEKRSA